MLYLNLMIHSVTIILIIALSIAVVGYRRLTKKLTEQILDWQCKEPGCENLKYYTTPTDEAKGVRYDYCSVHLMEKVDKGEIG